MNFSALSIRNPIPAIMLFALLTVAGLLAFNASKVQDFPDIELPIVTVTATLDGAAPAQLETEVARKMEDSIATLQGIKNIYTRVLDGVATITVEFILERDPADAVNDVRDAVSRVRADMPAEMRDPTVTKTAAAGRVVSTFTVEAARGSGLDDQDLSWFVDNDVSKRLLSVPGLGAVKRVGGVTREVRSNWTINGWPRCACRRWTSRASCAMCSARRRADAATWPASSNRCAPWPPCRPRSSWRRWTSRCRTAATCASTRWPT